MNNRISLRKVVAALVTVLVATAWTAAGLNFVEVWQAYRDAQNVLAANELVDSLLQAGQSVAYERGRTNVVLGAVGAVSPEDRDYLAMRRQEVDRQIAELPLPVDGQVPAEDDVKDAWLHLRALRAEVDAAIAGPLQNRDPALVERWFAEASSLIDALGQQAAASSLRWENLTPAFRVFSRVKVTALALRDSEGAIASRISAGIASKEPISPADMEQIMRLRGLSDARWESLRREQTLVGTASSSAQMKIIESDLFGGLRAMQGRVLAASRTGAPYPVSLPEMKEQAVGALAAISRLLELESANTRAYADSHLQQCYTAVAWQGLVVLLSGVLGLATIIILVRGVFSPLSALEGCLHALAQGDTVAVGVTERWLPAEFGRLNIAAQAFRDALVQKQQMADELRETSERLSSILDHHPGTVVRFRYRQGAPREIIFSAGNSLILRESHLLQLDESQDLYHPDDRDLVNVRTPQILREKGETVITFRRRRLDGSWTWLRAWERVVEHDGDDMITEAVTFNVSEEMLAKEALERSSTELRQASQRLAGLVSSLPGVVFTASIRGADRKITFLSDGFERYCGMPSAEFLAMPYAEQFKFLHPDDREGFLHRWDKASPREVCISRARFVRRDGDVRWFEFHERVTSADDQGFSVGGVAQDITDKVMAEQALERSEATRRKMEERLLESRRLAALGRLAGGVAHDFNNILATILGFGGFIAEDFDAAHPVQRHAARILKAAHRGRDLVERLLALSGNVEPRLSTFAIGDMLKETLEEFRNELPPQITLHDDWAEIGGLLRADRQRLGKCLHGLCLNAIEAIGVNPGRVVVSARPVNARPEGTQMPVQGRDGGSANVDFWCAPDGTMWAAVGNLPAGIPCVSISVRDDGPGMDAETLSQVFAPFFTTKDRARNAGLGLSVIQGIVLAHGGAMTVGSYPGHGATVEIILPMEGASGT